MDRPLVTFSLSCYNQEAFIGEAVAGAFAQTYSPLEILISDDCSKDRTFAIVQEMAAAYKGPHTVRLNRNARNLGLGGNANRLTEMCQGELSVAAAGDDISLPERTEIVVRAWNDSGCKAMSLGSRCQVIDQSGRPISAAEGAPIRSEAIRFSHEEGTIAGFLRRRRPHITGAANAVSRRLFALFGPFPEGITYEDTALCFRTVLAGGKFTFIDAPLVKYRRHEGNITFDLERVHSRVPLSFAEVQRKRRVELDRLIAVYKGFSVDAERAKQQGLIPLAEYPDVEKRIRDECWRLELRRELLSRGWLRRCAIFCKLYYNTVRPRELLTQLPYLLPRELHCVLAAGLNQVRLGASKSG
jgi:glycosyltransferase involved in cell wall biosynthesis